MAVALDSNAVVGFLDRSDIFHEAADSRIRALVGEGTNLYASAVTYAEVLTGAKLGHHDEVTVRGFFADLVTGVFQVDAKVAERAAELRSLRRALKMPDALILAGADLHPEVDLILCSDAVAAKAEDLLGCEVEALAPRR